MEMLILVSALGIAALIGIVKGFHYSPNELSEFELARRAGQGDGAAAYELHRRPMLPALSGLRSFKIILLTSLLATLLIATHEWWAGLVLLFGIWLVTEFAVSKGWLAMVTRRAQHKAEPKLLALAKHTAVLFKHFAPKHDVRHPFSIGSRQEFLHLIDSDTAYLAPAEKSRVQAALAFDGLRVADIMVPRDQIAAVDIKETVGPVLLDKLHKAGRKIFVAIKKDIDHVAGLVYMRDLVSGHPELKKVSDAVRATVHTLPEDAPLTDVLAASLRTGRQLFIVADNDGRTKGLVTLSDALERLNGAPIAKDIPADFQTAD